MIVFNCAVKENRNNKPIEIHLCDIDENIIHSSVPYLAHSIKDENASINAHVCRYEECILNVGQKTEKLFLFLGSTIGNMSIDEQNSLFSAVSDNLSETDHFLLAFDLDKDKQVIVSAYSDAAGYQEKQSFQMLYALNKYYGANFQVDAFKYEVEYDDRKKIVLCNGMQS